MASTPPSSPVADAAAANSDFDREIEERFLRYAASTPRATRPRPTSPSTEKQFDLLRLLVDELTSHRRRRRDADRLRCGPRDDSRRPSRPARRPSPCSPTSTPRRSSTPPASSRSSTATTTAATSLLPDAPDLVLSPEPSPYLAARVGDDIVTASGTTLLGADDKAGVAIIMTAARHLLAAPGASPHGPIRIAFTPDEEIGRGVHADLPQDLDADVRLHARRRRARRDRLRDLLGRQGGGADRGRLDPPGPGQGQAGQRPAPRREDRRHPAAGHAARRRPPTAARASSTSTR